MMMEHGAAAADSMKEVLISRRSCGMSMWLCFDFSSMTEDDDNSIIASIKSYLTKAFKIEGFNRGFKKTTSSTFDE